MIFPFPILFPTHLKTGFNILVTFIVSSVNMLTIYTSLFFFFVCVCGENSRKTLFQNLVGFFGYVRI